MVCVIVLLLRAADKPLEESGLLWILSGGRQTGSVGSDRKPGGFVGSSRFSSLSLCTMTQLVKRRQKQQTGTDINTCHHHLNKQLAGRSDLQQLTVLRAQTEFRRSDKTSDCGGARLADFTGLLFLRPNLPDTLLSNHCKFNTEGLD
ncbi:hypothetical protein KUCAC02_018917 [Chaenocephalus aceratus]|uniref:Uncharacterized protein n=1 Tax=Chaenocephalus aceratus TaxID=36190 RepID=A0ACB9WAV3_CHAAC|nr:hypothetical protein KUCAC02_018917 [Chaenocephalus aceratus]